MNQVRELAELIERVSGIVMPEWELERLQSLAEQRAEATGQRTVGGYLRYLAGTRDSDEWRQLLERITVNESSLFRGPQQFRALAERVLPRLIATRPDRRLRLWSAGCARGEEAASLAVVLAETVGLAGRDWRILASDVSQAAIEQARRARFGRRAMAAVEPRFVERYFTAREGALELAAELRERITFRVVNLVEEPLAAREGPFDVVFLRNVLIYFRAAAQRSVVARLARSLTDDGALFVGPSESLWQLHTALEPEDLGDCFCYRRPDPVRRAPEPDSPRTPVVTANSRQRQRGRRHLRAHEQPVTTAPSPEELADELAKLVQAGEAEQAVRRAVAASRLSPDDPVLRALEGRAWELAGEPERAVSAFRAALYLEPRLADVRFLLAGCLDQLGRSTRGERERRAVLAALAGSGARATTALQRLGVPSLAEIEEEAREGRSDR